MSVLGHVLRTFPGSIICLDDRAWRDYNWFAEVQQQTEGKKYPRAMKIAMRDGIRRGPRYRFRFPTKAGEIIFGWAGRDTVGFRSEEDFSPEMGAKIRTFLESLQLGTPVIEAD